MRLRIKENTEKWLFIKPLADITYFTSLLVSDSSKSEFLFLKARKMAREKWFVYSEKESFLNQYRAAATLKRRSLSG